MKSRQAITWISIIAMAIGVAFTIYGLSKLPWPAVIPWGDDGKYRFIVFSAVVFVFVSLLVWRFQWSAFMAAALGGVLLAGLAGVLWPLLVTLWFALAAAILGRWLLRKMRAEVDDWTVHFLVGAGIYGTFIGLLAHFPVNYPGVFGAALALPVVLGCRILQQWFGATRQWIVQYRQPDRTSRWLEIAIAVIALVHFVVALMPEVGFDALAMHLFVPAHLSSKHQWSFDATNYVWAVMPMMGDWIYSIGFLLAGETASRLINVGFIFILGWLIRDIVIWAGGSITAARWAILIFLSTPLAFAESGSLFIESIWTSFAVAGTLAILRYCSVPHNQKLNLLAAGILLGYALAAKAVTFTILPVLLLLMVIKYKVWLKATNTRYLILGLCFFLLLGLIPYVTAWQLTGNPVFPFFNHLFKSSYYSAAKDEFSVAVFGKGMPWDILYRATFHTGKYLEARPGAIGFQWLLILLPTAIVLIVTKHRRGIALLLFGILTAALSFNSTAYLRYIFPAVTVLIAAMGIGISTFPKLFFLNTRFLQGIVLVTIALNLSFFTAASPYTDFPLGSIVSDTHRQQYLAEHLPLRNAVEMTNALNTGRTPVAVFASPLAAGLKSDALYASWYNFSWYTSFTEAKTEQELGQRLVERRVDWLIVDSATNSKEKLDLIEKVSDPILVLGTTAVRRLKNNYRFKKELLINPDFSEPNGWEISDSAVFDKTSKSIISDVNSPVVQGVAVLGGQRYLNTVVARCHKEKTQGRIQVNWADANGQFIRPDIKVFDCLPEWHEFQMEVTAPINAAKAAVYATSHLGVSMEFKSVSFAQ